MCIRDSLIALRQTNLVRMLAYSGIAQAGYMIAPLAVFGQGPNPELAQSAIVNYLVIYAAMNLGAFTVVIIGARKTQSAEIESFGGMFRYSPGLAAAMVIFLFSLTGIPPMGGWLAKFQVFKVLIEADTNAGLVLALIGAVNSVIAAFYYLSVAKNIVLLPSPDGDNSPIKIPPALTAALAITVVVTIATGVTSFAPDITDFGAFAAAE